MTDIFLGDTGRSTRPRKVLFVVFALVLAACAWYWLAHSGAASTTESAPAAADAAPPSAPAVDAAAPLLQEADQLAASDRLMDARAKALEAMEAATTAPARQRAEGLLDRISIELALSPREMPEKVEYVVQPGDSLDKIAKKFGTTVDLIRKSNNISGSIIRGGQHLRVLQGTFHIVVDKSDNTLTLLLDGQYFKRYRVGTGQYNKTPVGAFKVTDKIAQPTWWRPDGKQIPFGDPENLLGTHWIAIDSPGYGIHGTWEPDTIGKQLSAGCVRLLNEDVEQIFTLVPVGTAVTIQD
jgi:lipoprotein-anchoring transpeptidase ErfK/SrfK